MSILIDERLEGVGYEETWSLGEATAGGSAIDEDTATSGVTGAPDNWDDDCVTHTYVASNNCYFGDVNALVADEDEFWLRVEFIVNSESLANDQQNALFHVLGNNGSTALVYAFLRQVSGSLLVRIFDTRDDTANNTNDSVNQALNVPFVVEIMWDNTNNVVAALVDGRVIVDFVTITGSTAAVTPADSVVIGTLGGSCAAAQTSYADNIIASDAEAQRIGTGRFHQGMQSLGTGVGTKALNKAHTQIDGMRAGLQAA